MGKVDDEVGVLHKVRALDEDGILDVIGVLNELEFLDEVRILD